MDLDAEDYRTLDHLFVSYKKNEEFFYGPRGNSPLVDINTDWPKF